MWQDKLKEIINILENSNVNEIEIKSWGHQYRVVKNPGVLTNTLNNLEPPTMVGELNPDQKNNINKEQNSLEAKAVPETAMEKVLYPRPGTFYAAPTP